MGNLSLYILYHHPYILLFYFFPEIGSYLILKLLLIINYPGIRINNVNEVILFSLNESRYAVSKNDILFIKIIQKVHEIPFASAEFSHLSILNNKVVNLIDISIYLDCPRVNHEGPFSLLVLSEQEKLAGFFVNGMIKEEKLVSQPVLDIPDYLKTPYFHTCLFLDREIIPFIKIGELYKLIKKGDFKRPQFQFSVKRMRKRPAINKFKIFEYNNQLFAISSKGIQSGIIKPEIVCNLPFAPSYMEGLVHYEGKVLPLIRLAAYMHLPVKKKEEGMFIYHVQEQSFGFLVAKEKEEITCKTGMVKTVPPIMRTTVQSHWLNEAIIDKEQIIPLVNLNSVLTNKPDNELIKPLDQMYKGSSLFSSKIYKEKITVFEFPILGAFCAVPESEVEAVVNLSSIWPLPAVSSIILGITLYKDEIIPVLDLAMCYGKRSSIQDNWKMILIKNGNFRAFIVTKAVSGKQVLPLDIQKRLPLSLPHPIVYGCYLKEKHVSLIFNVMAAAVHFNTPIVKVVKELTSQFQGDAFLLGTGTEEKKEVTTKPVRGKRPELEEKTPPEEASVKEEPPEIVEEIKQEDEPDREEVPAKELPLQIVEEIKQEDEPAREVTAIEEPAKTEEENPVITSEEIKPEEEYPLESGEATIKESENEEVPVMGTEVRGHKGGEDRDNTLDRQQKEETKAEQKVEQIVEEKLEQKRHGKGPVKAPVKKEKTFSEENEQKSKKWPIVLITGFSLFITVFLIFIIVNIPGLNRTQEEGTVNTPRYEGITDGFKDDTAGELLDDVTVFPNIFATMDIKLENIQFLPDSFELLPQELEKLNKIVQILQKYKADKLYIAGHTAFIGITETLQELSENRANAVRDYLLSLGIWNEDQIIAIGMGYSESIADNRTEEGRRKNRRVEIKIISD
jgi:outer membrane protein OmpA-like peptidoglycan-associated protein/chemotaxis signal transduction protein